MKDVAALAGVSPSTVSRVFSGSASVAPAAADRVRAAAARLGYRRNLTASTLRRLDRHSATIGLAWEDVSNPFFSAVQRGIEEVARQQGILTLVGSSDEEPERERALVEAFCSRGVDGLVIAPTSGDQSYLHRDLAMGLAVVFVDRPPRHVDVDSVISDNTGGSELAVAHLIRHGHRRIAFLGDRPEVYTAAARFAGYRSALAQAGIDVRPELVQYARYDAVNAYRATVELMRGSDPPTALFTSQNLITTGALRALRELALHPTVALVGFDDLPLAEWIRPGVTVVAQDAYALGRSAARLLFSQIDGYRGASRQVVLPVRLVERGTGELPPRD